MATPSGQISAQDIKNEFGETGEGKVALGSYRVSQTKGQLTLAIGCLLYTSPSPRDAHESRMPSSA